MSTQDHFYLAVPDMTQYQHPTKREVVTCVARVYDILGWFSPVCQQIKLLLQELWRRDIGWDSSIPEDLLPRLQDWQNNLHLLRMHPVPRHYSNHNTPAVAQQLHGFADVWSHGLLHPHSIVSVSLITAKMKVGPVKPSTIPRKELNTALLLARLLKTVAEDLSLPTSALYYAWSDFSVG